MPDTFNNDEHTVPNPNIADDSSDAETVKSTPAPPPIYRTSTYSSSQPNIPAPPAAWQESSPQMRRKRRRTKGNRDGDWAWVIIAVAMLGVILTISLVMFLFLRTQNNRDVIPTAESVIELLPTPLDVRTDPNTNDIIIGEQLELPDGSSIQLVPWDGESRFTFVMVGLDRRPGETGLRYRTDSMMVVSIDPETNAIGVLSIPRDLYVQVPGYGELQRINTPMVLGELRQENYGPTLLMQTVQLNMGIRIHDYVAVDFQAFIEMIDAIGGIDVVNESTINDAQYPNMFYGYDPFYLPTGEHHLDGATALKFARSRHGNSDIDRAKRQQQTIYAIRDKVLSANMLPQLIGQAPALWSAWSDNVYTNLRLDQIIPLGLYLKDIPLENIQMGVVDFRYLQSYTTPSGASVLIPNRARLGNLMIEVFGVNYAQ